MKTTCTCTGCGKPIPEALANDALCTGCRYHDTGNKPVSGRNEYDVAIETIASPEPQLPSSADKLGHTSAAYFVKLLLRGEPTPKVAHERLILADSLMDGLPNVAIAERLDCTGPAITKKIQRFKKEVTGQF
jgi:hypothetical protein